MKNKRNAVAQISDRIVNSMKPSLVAEYCYGIFRYRINGRSLTPIDLQMKFVAVIITLLWISIAYIVGIKPKLDIVFMILYHAEDNQKVVEYFANIDISLHASTNDGFYKSSSKECKKMKIEIVLLCEIMFFVRQRLLLIRDYLIKFISDRNQLKSYPCRSLIKNAKLDECINYIGRASNRNNKILDLASAFYNVGEVFEIINSIYNFTILMLVVSAFVFILASIWCSLSFLKVKSNDKSMDMTLSTAVFWSTAEIFSSKSLWCICDTAVDQAVVYTITCRLSYGGLIVDCEAELSKKITAASLRRL
ncbi:uncharacterized protein [Battus philenor]|uniref:uncharacterized protein n=1 Tax=Battus philenor TaxID=42288 RepID=UPI0035CED0D7